MAVRIVSIIMLPLFLMSVAVQYNDPDPWAWVFIYSFPAIVAAMGAFNQISGLVVIMSVVYSIGGALQMPWADLARLGEYVSQWHMKNDNAELMREAIGLFICAAYLDFLTVVWFKRRNRAAGE